MVEAASSPDTVVKDGKTAHEIALELFEEEACTLATASADGTPEAATVRFVADEEYDVYLNTATTYRKYENMVENPRVAVVVTRYTEDLQLEGRAEEVDAEDAGWIRDRYVEKYGHSDYLTCEDAAFFRIETDWARLLVDGQYPPSYVVLQGEAPTDLHTDV